MYELYEPIILLNETGDIENITQHDIFKYLTADIKSNDINDNLSNNVDNQSESEESYEEVISTV